MCKNSHQVHKPEPPHFWYNLKIKCRDYKIRHCCKCLFGCPDQGNAIAPKSSEEEAAVLPFQMPQVRFVLFLNWC